jgi:hypothetical protein
MRRIPLFPELSDTGTDFNTNLNFIQGGLANSWVVFQVLAELSSLLSADEAADVLLDPEVGEALSPAQLDAVLSSLSTQALERIPQLITKVSLIRKLELLWKVLWIRIRIGSGFLQFLIKKDKFFSCFFFFQFLVIKPWIRIRIRPVSHL